jgi:hypothetical protein
MTIQTPPEMLDLVRPAILDSPLWQELRKYIYATPGTDKSRAHFNFMSWVPESLIKDALKLRIRCANPKCELLMCPIRKHRNCKTWSLHVTGSRSNGHQWCTNGAARKACTALQLDIGQAISSPRIQKVIEKTKQRTFFDKDIFGPPEVSG